MIDTKALRSKVLDLAIQGKLTEQLESDRTAEELFAQIQEEKQKLIKEGKIKKEKALPPIKDDEIPFDIPSNWKWCRLSDIGSTNIGLTYHPCDVKEKGTLVIRSSNIQNGKMDYSNRVFVNCSVKDNQYLQKNDIIICARNGSKALVGKNAIYDGESNKVAFGAFMAVFRTSIYFYTYYYFNTQVFKRYFSNDDSKQINQVTQSILKESVIPLPPLAEQKRIVERVEEIFKLLDIIDEAQKKYSADAEILKSKLITMGIQGKLTKQLDSDGTAEELYQQIQEEKQIILNNRKGRKDNSIIPIDSNVPFTIPKNWKWIRFGETGFFRKGPFGSSLTKAMFVPKNNDTIKVYEQQHAIQKNSTLGTYYITKEYFESKMSGFEVCAGDIIVSCAGTIGETYVMPENIEKGIINQALMRITLVPSIEKRFFLYYFDANLKQDAQSGNGSAITNIPPFDVLKNWCFPLPPLAEQKRIADTLDEVLRVIG